MDRRNKGWIKAQLDGALSIGRLNQNDLKRDRDVHQKPEALHFGISEPDPILKTYRKVTRDPETGAERHGHILKSIPWQNDDPASRVLAIEKLAQRLTGMVEPKTQVTLSPGQFALQMIEGVERVRFMRGPAQVADHGST